MTKPIQQRTYDNLLNEAFSRIRVLEALVDRGEFSWTSDNDCDGGAGASGSSTGLEFGSYLEATDQGDGTVRLDVCPQGAWAFLEGTVSAPAFDHFATSDTSVFETSSNTAGDSTLIFKTPGLYYATCQLKFQAGSGGTIPTKMALQLAGPPTSYIPDWTNPVLGGGYGLPMGSWPTPPPTVFAQVPGVSYAVDAANVDADIEVDYWAWAAWNVLSLDAGANTLAVNFNIYDAGPIADVEYMYLLVHHVPARNNRSPVVF